MTCRLLVLGLWLFSFSASTLHAQHPTGVEPGESYHRIFVLDFEASIDPFGSFPPSFPDFGSLPAADWYVTEAALIGGLLETWNGIDLIYTALLSDSTVDARDRVTLSGPVYNVADDLIANDHADLWDGSLQNPIKYDQFGTAVPVGTRVWTGSGPVGTHGLSCIDWSTTSGDGDYGNAHSTTDWIGTGSQPCALSARIYGISPAITLPDSADFDGDDDIDGADFLTWQRNFGTGTAHNEGDSNGDDFIDAADLAVWQSQYGGAPPGGAASASVPEPSALLLAAMGVFLVPANHRKR